MSTGMGYLFFCFENGILLRVITISRLVVLLLKIARQFQYQIRYERKCQMLRNI